MDNLTKALSRACSELNITIRFGVELTLSDHSPLVVFAHMPSLGGPNGMLIFRNYDITKARGDDFVLAGYGYSVLDEPPPNECFDLDSYKEMFIDWGWQSNKAG